MKRVLLISIHKKMINSEFTYQTVGLPCRQAGRMHMLPLKNKI